MKRGPKPKHGMSGTKTYQRWVSMWQRCTNPHTQNYEYWGGRGIKVCDRWKEFTNFYEDMGPQPPGMHLERLNNDGDYCPENCAWVTQREQNRNKQYHVYVEVNGKSMLCTDAMRLLNILPHGLYHRIRKFGETHQQAVDNYVRLRRRQRRLNW